VKAPSKSFLKVLRTGCVTYALILLFLGVTTYHFPRLVRGVMIVHFIFCINVLF